MSLNASNGTTVVFVDDCLRKGCYVVVMCKSQGLFWGYPLLFFFVVVVAVVVVNGHIRLVV